MAVKVISALWRGESKWLQLAREADELGGGGARIVRGAAAVVVAKKRKGGGGGGRV